MSRHERIRNILRGFGPITDTERIQQIAQAEQVVKLTMGQRVVSLWNRGPTRLSGKG